MIVDPYGLHPVLVRKLEDLAADEVRARKQNAVLATASRIATSVPGMKDGVVGLEYWNGGANLDWAVTDVRAAAILTHKRLLDFGFHFNPKDYRTTENGMSRTFQHRHLPHFIFVHFSLAEDATCEMVKVGERMVDVLELQCGGAKVELGETP